MEGTRIFTVQELVHGRRPLSAAHSLHLQFRTSSVSTESRSDKSLNSYSNLCSNPNPNPRVLRPLNFPAVIVGTVTLPVTVSEGNSNSGNATFKCPYGSCLQFSDGSAMICCDVLDLDLGIIGKKIWVLAWNFLPIKRECGFLEIIRWSFSSLEIDRSQCSETQSFQLDSSASLGCVVNSNSRHCLHGTLELISPISVNPCLSEVSDSNPAPHLYGFLVRLKMCECRLYSSGETIQDLGTHRFTKPVIVYFCGSASSWHPVITKLVGRVVSISGLKKKLVCFGNKESCLVYVTAEKSYLHVPRFKKNLVLGGTTCIEGQGECGSYTGVVKGVYLQGMIVELDNEVWLLLTNHLLKAPHSLRVGALISVRNVHFLNPKFSWSKMLILGACYKTSIMVKCFSPGMAGCYVLSHSASMLGYFIESVAFSARLWVLLIVSSFRKKFSGILSEKEILGTKNKEGLVQMYASLQIPSNLLRSSENKHGVFMSLCMQSLFCCEGHNGKNLKLVLPICSFIHRCNAKWMRTVGLENDTILCEGRTYGRLIRKVFSSEEIGIILIGSLKISPSSGRLQLVDATGEVDIVIPDLPESWNTNEIYEVADYSLVIEGIPGLVDSLGLADEPFSCRSVFNFIPPASELNLTVYVHFYLRNTACKNILLYPRSELGEDLQRLKCGKYHLLQVNHKFPVLKKFRSDSAISNTPTVFAEAVIYTGCNLLLSGNDGFVRETKDSRDDLKKDTGHYGGVVLQENLSKRRKTDYALRTLSTSSDSPCTTVRQLSGCSNCDAESSEKHMNEISCSATVRTAKNQRVVHSATLHYTGSKVSGSGISRPTALKVLMEFQHESLYTFQSLQIGCYYITEHTEEKCVCKHKDSKNVGGIKIHVSPESHFWSLSFAHDVPLGSDLSSLPTSDDTCSDSDKISSRDHNELRLHMLDGDHLETSSDVFLSVPANRIGIPGVYNDILEEGMIKSVERYRGIHKVSACSRSVSSASALLPDNNFLQPEGNLISLRGRLIATHNIGSNTNCQSHGDTLQSRMFNGASSCLHLLVQQQTVKLFGFVDKQFFPPGFGPGVDVTFHRVLELSEKDRWMLTPVSFIVINSLRLADTPPTERSSSSVLEMNGVTSLENMSLFLISELVEHLDCKLRRLRCRVVAVNILVFEINLQQNLCSSESQVDIPIASFVLDDGSSTCCCWTSAERAATFLRLHEELPKKDSKSSDRRLNMKAMMEINTCHSIAYRLRRILQKHTRITVKNFGSLLDSSYQELAVSVSSGNTLNRSDEAFLKFLAFKACTGPSWTVVASIMDSDTISHLEKQQNLLQLDMDTSFMPNIWAKEVHFTNPLTEASSIIQELLGR